MTEKVAKSIKFLMLEYERLLKKQKDGQLSKSELETFNSLKKFLGKNRFILPRWENFCRICT